MQIEPDIRSGNPGRRHGTAAVRSKGQNSSAVKGVAYSRYGPGRWLKDLLIDNPYRGWFLITLAVVNLLGSLYGYYWYAGQLAATPLYWWPFTPDSPLATTLFGLALLLAYCRRENGLLRLVAAAAVIKYGLWAMVVIGDFWMSGAAVTPVEAGLWLSHLGMVLEGVIFLRHWEVAPRQLALVVLWLVINDYLDYGLSLHPYLFRAEQEGLAMVTAATISLAIILYLVRAINSPAGRKSRPRGRIV